MASAGTVFVDLKLNTAQFLKDVEAAGAEAGAAVEQVASPKATSSMKSLSVAGIAVAGAIGFIGKESIDAAESLEKAVDRTKVTFGSSKATVQDWAKGAATSMGQAQSAALNTADAFGNIGKTAGLQGKALTDFATSLSQRTADIAAAQGKDFDDVQSKIISGLNGRGKALKQLGIDINDTTVKEQAMKDGIISSTTQALTPAQKTLESYRLIMADTANQAGFFADHQDRLGESTEIAKAKLKNAEAEIGNALLPVLAKAASGVGDLAADFSKLPGPVQQAVVGLVGTSAAIAGVASAAKFLQVGKIIDSVKGLSGAFVQVGEDGERSLTGIGVAATGLGTILAALAAGDAVAAIGNTVTGVGQKAEDDVHKFQIAAAGAEASSNDLLKTFADLAGNQHLSVTGSFIDLGVVPWDVVDAGPRMK
jgi:hypothetical protein